MSDHIFRFTPDEDRLLSFQMDAHGTTSLYFSIRYFKEGGSFHWDSPWIREQVHGEVTGLGNSDGLDLQFWADTPSGEHEELGEIKTKKLSNGEEVSYTLALQPFHFIDLADRA
ncbi:MAG: hypothetical protein WA364_17925 [Candidatus Nitrosopolaris sp.]